MLSYAGALDALESRGRFGVHLGLSRTRALLAALGHPEQALRGALIAGTNGKGSVVALVGAALTAAGYRVGLTPKPHLVTYRERLQIDGLPVDEDGFARIVAEVLPLADRVARRHGDPTEFELLTAVMFRWFAEQGIDLAVVEVGLGGRLDATHAWDGGVAVVTNVALDHMDRLGSTVEAIAHEKAAIIMRGDLAVTGATGGALAVVRRRAARVAAPLTAVEPGRIVGLDRDGIEVELSGGAAGRPGRRVRVGLRGRHQAANVAVADATLDALEAAGIARIPAAARQSGYASVRWPGRLELVTYRGRELLLDGAHNPAGASTLAEALDDLAPFLSPGRATLIVAIMADKDVEGVVDALVAARLLADARIICTAPAGARALSPRELADRWRAAAARRGLAGAAPEIAADPAAALDLALSAGAGVVVVAGSLYLVGAVRALAVDDPRLVPDPPRTPADGAVRTS